MVIEARKQTGPGPLKQAILKLKSLFHEGVDTVKDQLQRQRRQRMFQPSLSQHSLSRLHGQAKGIRRNEKIRMARADSETGRGVVFDAGGYQGTLNLEIAAGDSPKSLHGILN
jgi:hypothetical protein